MCTQLKHPLLFKHRVKNAWRTLNGNDFNETFQKNIL